MFHDADTSGDGVLDEEELAVLLKNLRAKMGQPLSDSEKLRCVEHVIVSMAAVDKEGTGTVTFDGFIRCATAPLARGAPRIHPGLSVGC